MGASIEHPSLDVSLGGTLVPRIGTWPAQDGWLCQPVSRLIMPPAWFRCAGFIHSRPEALYFWFYFVFVNAIWIVVPLCCVAHAWGKIAKAVAAAGASGRKGKKA